MGVAQSARSVQEQTGALNKDEKTFTQTKRLSHRLNARAFFEGDKKKKVIHFRAFSTNDTVTKLYRILGFCRFRSINSKQTRRDSMMKKI